MKLTTRYNRFIFPSILLLFILSITSSYFLIRKVLQNELDGVLRRTQQRVISYVADNKKIPAVSSFNDQIITFEPLTAPLTDGGYHSATQYIPEQNKNHISRKLVFQLNVNGSPYKVTISEPLEGTRHLTILIAKIAIVTIFVIVLMLIIINRAVLAKVWKPFYQSLQHIKSFRVNGEAQLVFPKTNIEEFRLMNDHFSLAADNAILDYRNLKEFSENASHETQTPLSIIRSNLDNLIQHENLTEKQSELIQSAYAAVSKLSRMQQALLLLTKIDARQFDLNTRINLRERLQYKIAEFSELWTGKGLHYTEALNDCFINANNDLLEVLLNNLFNNAMRHNQKEGAISIYCTQGCLQISNTGNPHPLDRERIFRRFYKGSLKSEHNGLGLSIVKKICDASGIQINYDFDNGWHRFSLNWKPIQNVSAGLPSDVANTFTPSQAGAR